MSNDSPTLATKIERLRALVLRSWVTSGLAPSADALRRRWRGDAPPDGSDRSGNAPATSTPRTVVALALHPLLERFGELAALSLVINLLSLAVPIFVLQVYDRVVFHGGLATLGGLVIGVIVALGFDFILRQARSRLVQRIALRVDVGLIRMLLDKLTNLPLRRLEAQSDTDWDRLLRDQETVRDTMAGPATILLVDLPFILLFIGVIWLVAQPIAWLLLALVPVYVAVAAFSSWAIGLASQREQSCFDQRQVQSTQLVRGRAAAKALGLGATLQQAWERSQADLIRGSLHRGGRVDLFTNLSTGLAMATTVAMTSTGALAIVQGQLTIGGLIAANMLAARVVQPLVQLIGIWRVASRLREAALRLNALIAEPTDQTDSALARGRPRGVLTLEDVAFGYEAGGEALLRGIDVTLRPGGVHGIVGMNGSGKTTLLKVMQGLYPPDRGRVLLDGADLRQFGRQDLAAWIGYLPQDPFLVAGTIRDNIARLDDDVDDETILLAAKRANADRFIVDLPDGYRTEVGENGNRFSAGQRQRIALARALIEDPSVLLLDEPNAHLDGQATQQFLSQMRHLSRGRTVILVTHSQPLLAACDTVLVLTDGTIAAAGPGNEMVERLFKPQPSGVAA
ncbi:MAG: ATP-binding cassette domain-containing protein [Alphaproteobacteria bacterium]